MTAVSDAASAVDQGLAEIAGAFAFLTDVSPVNVTEAWEGFRASGHRSAPTFHYAPLSADPAALRRGLDELPLDSVADEGLRTLFDGLAGELRLRLAIIEERGTPSVLGYAVGLWGSVEPRLLELAEGILDLVGDAPRADPATFVGAEVFAEAAREEIARYRERFPGISSRVHVRDDVAGVLVERQDVLVDSRYMMDPVRVDALVHHEVGTHVVTYENGRRQPLRLLADGLAGYEETQEGLAVLAEYAVGGLTVDRVVLLAARVLATAARLEDASFPEVFEVLSARTGLPPESCFDVVMRVYRAGGLTKDMVYLRGLQDVVAFLGGGGRLESLLVGKLPLHAVPVVEDLRGRGVLEAPAVTPRWVTDPAAARRLEALGPDTDLTALVPAILSPHSRPSGAPPPPGTGRRPAQ